jgi:LysM repeat protein
VRSDGWRRYAAPAAFLLAATVAIVLVRSGIDAGDDAGTRTGSVPTITRKQVATTTTTKRRATTTGSSQAFWVVQAGDTFGVISTKTGVPVATIERLNPNASSTSLFIGEKIRLR